MPPLPPPPYVPPPPYKPPPHHPLQTPPVHDAPPSHEPAPGHTSGFDGAIRCSLCSVLQKISSDSPAEKIDRLTLIGNVLKNITFTNLTSFL